MVQEPAAEIVLTRLDVGGKSPNASRLGRNSAGARMELVGSRPDSVHAASVPGQDRPDVAGRRRAAET